ncbi:hypothetical protein E6C60_3235 [Paenibacillus algicola]|uniref:Uncharacterized protein n=1 Tax=Paenibacillus algicola TaxID=2565926 RepID=A0A4P8XMD4_9BACL|nr:hypothetical protein [Paenibacillus algicola]QCT03946.1 hypothetical protein E6C60_3235 [Paenibacillus algicola]
MRDDLTVLRGEDYVWSCRACSGTDPACEVQQEVFRPALCCGVPIQ